MKNQEEINVLKEIRKNVVMAINAIDTLMGKVYNQEFSYELVAERNRFREFKHKAEAELFCLGMPVKDSKIQKAMLISAIHGNTAFNISTPHVAEMVIQGNTRGIGELLKVRHNNKNAGSFANELAEELMDFEEINMERLKQFL
ncbi:MAG: hypothetical protein RR139_08020 [Lachnospiraceae bacterium]